MAYKTIAKQIPMFQAIGLLGRGIKAAKKPSLKGIIGGFAGVMVGLPLMKKTANILAGL